MWEALYIVHMWSIHDLMNMKACVCVHTCVIHEVQSFGYV